MNNRVTKDAMKIQTICDDFQRFFADKIAKIAEKMIKSIISSGYLPPPVVLRTARYSF